MKNGPYEMIIAPDGYPGKKYRGRYAYEHHIVWWKKHGELPRKGFEIHHKNGGHRDNRLCNLKLLSGSEHKALHAEKKHHSALRKVKCGNCGRVFKRLQSAINERLKVRRFGKLFCSISCGAIHQYSRVP